MKFLNKINIFNKRRVGRTRKPNLAIFVLAFVVLLGVAYSAFGTELNIGKFLADVRLKKDIRITGLSVKGSSSGPCSYTKDNDGNEMVTCGTESFYVVEKTASEVTMLSAYNITLSTTSPRQDTTDTTYPAKNSIEFSSSEYWVSNGQYTVDANYASEGRSYPYVYNSSSSTYQYVEAYRDVLEGIGVNVQDAKLLSYEQAVALGCTNYSCDSAPEWVSRSDYWVGSSYYSSVQHMMWYIGTSVENYSGTVVTNRYFSNNPTYVPHGVRPLITIPTSDITRNSNGGESKHQDYNKDSISSEINLPNENSSITYTVEITNIEATEMGILEITGLPNNLEIADTSFLKEKICDDSGKCNLGITKNIDITLQYKEGSYDSSNTKFNLNLKFNFKPFYKVTYKDIGKTICTLDDKDFSGDASESDIVTCTKGNISESFYVVDNVNGKIDMLSAYNITLSTTSPKQDPTDTTYPAKNSIAFSSSEYWGSNGQYTVDANYASEGRSYPYVYNSSSSTYQYVEAYRDVLEGIGVNVQDAKLLSYEQAVALGCTNYSCDSAPEWVSRSDYWVGSDYYSSVQHMLWYIGTSVENYSGTVVTNRYFSNNPTYVPHGVRPLITILENELLPNTSKYPEEVMSGDTLRIDLGEDAPILIKVLIDGVETTNYTYANGILTINNVSGNVKVQKDSLKCILVDTDGDNKIDTGEAVTCTKGDISESFYVVDSSNGNVNMLSKYNLTLSTTSPIQDTTGNRNPIEFSSSGYWYNNGYIVDTNYANEGRSYPYVYNSSSNLYQYVEAYRNVLEGMGVNVIDAKLMSYEQATKLGCLATSLDCPSAPSWVNSSSYWLGSAYSAYGNNNVWHVFSNGGYFSTTGFNDGVLGVRPVITISESDLDIQKACEYTTDSSGNEMITCGTESFYPIEETSSTVTALSKYNITLSTTSPIQSNSAATTIFSSSSYWYDSSNNLILDTNYASEGRTYPYVYNSSSTLYQYVEAYRDVLEGMGINVIDAKIMSYEQTVKLGCSGTNCKSTPSWVYSTDYWLASADTGGLLKYVAPTGYINSGNYKYVSHNVRPLITFDKSCIE